MPSGPQPPGTPIPETGQRLWGQVQTPRSRWSLIDWSLAAAIALLTALRWPDRARWLTTWDSSSFALALVDYDVRALRPHAPGYPVYVAIAHVADAFAPDVNTGLVAVSLAAMAAAGVLLYGFVRRLRNRRTGLIAAVLLVCAPTAYTNSLIAANYAMDATFSVAIAWLAWECHHRPTRERAVALAAVFALGLGVRQSLLFYLTPLVLWGLLRPPFGVRGQVRRLAPAAAVALAIGLAWFIPMVAQSGGWQGWNESNAMQSEDVVFAHTAFNEGMPAVQANAARVDGYLDKESSWILPAALALAGAAFAMTRQAALPTRQAVTFFALWMLPALAFLVLVFSGYGNGPSGYILVPLPGIYAAAALAVDAAWERMPWRSARPLGVALLLAVSLPVQAQAWEHPVDFDWRAHDAWAESWDGIRAEYPPGTTALLSWWSTAHVWAHYRDYTVYSYLPLDEGPGGPPVTLLLQAEGGITDQAWYTAALHGADPTPHRIPPGIAAFILWDFELAGENGYRRRIHDDVPVREDTLDNGWRILVVDVDPQRPFVEDYIGEPLNRPRA